MTRRSLQRVLWSVAVICLVYAFVTTFILQVRYVDSGSMEPTIFGSEKNGESILVRLDRSTPQRFDIVVLRSVNGELLVKRVWGLPTENVAIRNGDVYIEDQLLAPSLERPKPITVFDDRWHDLGAYFVVEDTAWTKEDESWLVEAADVDPGSDAAMIFLHKKVHDAYLDQDNRIIEGQRVVNDLAAKLELRFEQWVDGASFRIDLREWGDSFEALIEPKSETTAQITLSRENAEGPPQELRTVEVSFTTGDWNEVEFSNIDNVLSLRVRDGLGHEDHVTFSYESNVFDPFDDRHVGKTLAHQIQFAASRSQLRVRSVRLARDLFFTARGEYAVSAPLPLSTSQIMVLGDNSARSRDGREFGATELDQIFGRAVRVVWPFSSWRSLRGR